MKVIVVRPCEQPKIEEIDGTLKSMQNVVIGDIEAIYPYNDKVAIVCNDESKFDCEPNRPLIDDSGKVYDIIFGNFFICGIGKEDFTDIPKTLINKYVDLFKL